MASSTPPVESLQQLLATVETALAMSDALGLDATGIALDTARLSVEEALAERGKPHPRAISG